VGPTVGLDIEPQILGRPERKYFSFNWEIAVNLGSWFPMTRILLHY
jgi:hypothetical protein